MQTIPHICDPQRHEKIHCNHDDFVLITELDGFDIQMQYPLLGMQNAEHRCMMRREVLLRLQKAQHLLPDGYKLRIWDAWRPFALQKELYEKYRTDIIKQFHLVRQSKEEQDAVIAKFVSPPNASVFSPPVHTTGGAVDVTLLDKNANELNMGTAFDAFSEKTQTDYFEINNGNEEIRHNRRLLYACMTKAGFTNLPSEWWHFDYGNRFWGYYNHCPALYEGIFTADKIHLTERK